MNCVKMDVLRNWWLKTFSRVMKDNRFGGFSYSLDLPQDEIAVQRSFRIGKPRGDMYY